MRGVMVMFWLAKYVGEYYQLKLLCGKQFKSLEEYSPLMQSYVIVDESILLISVKSAIVVLGPVNQKNIIF